jgi:hypothetical protein
MLYHKLYPISGGGEGSFPLTGDSYNIMCYVREKNSIGNIFKITTLIIRS